MISQQRNLLGCTFGRWRVIRSAASTHSMRKWVCKCLGCGKQKSIYERHLVSGQSSSCHSCASAKIPNPGAVFNDWTVLQTTIARRPICVCRCVCGKIKKVMLQCLRAGAKGCGCRRGRKPEAKIGNWMIEARTKGRGRNGSVLYNARCICGNPRVLSLAQAEKQKSCGCRSVKISGPASGMYKHGWTIGLRGAFWRAVRKASQRRKTLIDFSTLERSFDLWKNARQEKQHLRLVLCRLANSGALHEQA